MSVLILLGDSLSTLTAIGVSTLLARVRLLFGQHEKGRDRALIVKLTIATTSFQDVPQLEEGKSFETQVCPSALQIHYYSSGC